MNGKEFRDIYPQLRQPFLGEIEAVEAQRDAIRAERDSLRAQLEAIREAAGPFQRFADMRHYLPNATARVPSLEQFDGLLSAISATEAKRGGEG